MNIILNIRIPVEKDFLNYYLEIAASKLNLDITKIKLTKILSKSLDSRSKKQFYYDLSIVVKVPDGFNNKDKLALYSEEKEIFNKNNKKFNVKDKPIIVGFGPAGIFTALELINYGIKPIIFERGKKAEDRDLDIKNFISNRTLNQESNIQFGEGGAGLYSDGKLFSRIKSTKYINKVLDTFVKFGAPSEITYINKPHLGTDVLFKIIKNIRKHIIDNGGEINYNSKMTDIIIKDSKAKGVIINSSKEYLSSNIYLALGHSAREIFEMLFEKGVEMQQKPTSLGLRIEHPRDLINLMRYGEKYKNFDSASYNFTYTDKKTNRGVFSFCMCPGGEIINASSEDGFLVTNGMSYSKRNSPFSNSAVVVTCNTSDYPSTHPLAGIKFQRDIEKKAFISAGSNWTAPSQNLMDFMLNKESTKLIDNSYKMGVISSNIKEIFPNFISEALLNAFQKWKNDYPFFISDKAILIAPETRTSSPVRITRNERYESSVKNLYLLGEGSGYTGGITSSAVDGIKAVESSFNNKL